MHVVSRAAAARALTTLVAAACSSQILQPAATAAESDLVTALLERTAQNRVANEAAVRRQTERNAFSADSGEPNAMRQVLSTDGAWLYLTQREVAQMTRRGEMACAADGTCRVVDRGAAPLALELPELKVLTCNESGRNCKFK